MKKGFTLIELLVVISIIGLLSAVVLASLASARTKARDARRIADIKQIQTAVELYYDSYGQYPTSTSWTVYSEFQANLQNSKFMTKVPQELTFVPADAAVFGKISGGYHYDNWCQTPNPASSTQYSLYRLWAKTETNQKGLQNNWWDDFYVGATNCVDPS
jgi:prepilin-type N-terminal cleavage/methylation domain-containing protein